MTPQILLQCSGKKNNTYTFDNYQGKTDESNKLTPYCFKQGAYDQNVPCHYKI